MKNTDIIKALLLTVLLLVFACNGGTDRTETGEEQLSLFDETIADHERELIEITIWSTGNTFNDMDFSRDEIRVRPNHRIRLSLINESEDVAMVHNIVFVRQGSMQEVYEEGLRAGGEYEYVPPGHPDVIAHSGLVYPQNDTTFEFNAPRAGQYEFVCTYPGHWQMMNGKFIVE